MQGKIRNVEYRTSYILGKDAPQRYRHCCMHITPISHIPRIPYIPYLSYIPRLSRYSI